MASKNRTQLKIKVKEKDYLEAQKNDDHLRKIRERHPTRKT